MKALYGRDNPQVQKMEGILDEKKMQKHHVDFVLPDSLGRELEWTGLDWGTMLKTTEGILVETKTPKRATSGTISGASSPVLLPVKPTSTPVAGAPFDAIDKVFREDPGC